MNDTYAIENQEQFDSICNCECATCCSNLYNLHGTVDNPLVTCGTIEQGRKKGVDD